MNSTLFFVFCIVLVVLCANVITKLIDQKKSKPNESDELQETLAKIETLEERIKVLERIITEKRYNLKSEIESL